MAEAVLMRLKDPKTFNLNYSDWEYFIEAPNAIIVAYINPDETAIEVPEYIKGFRTQVMSSYYDSVSPFIGRYPTHVEPTSIDISKTNFYANNADYLFASCSIPTSLPSLPNGIISMRNTYEYCSNLTTTPTLPNTVTNMYGCFSSCSRLTSMPTIPRSVTEMSYAFYYASNLKTTTTIPNTVSNLYRAFEGCYNL